MQQMTFPLSNDWCTVAWAAEHLHVSPRTVARLVTTGVLDSVTPLVGERESRRHKRMLKADQVRAYKRALSVVRGE